MIKKLREILYNKHIKKELKAIKSFNDILFDENDGCVYFAEYAKHGIRSLFLPKSIYAIKSSIQKLDSHYVKSSSVDNIEKFIKKIIIIEKLDINKLEECISLFNIIKLQYENEVK